MNQNINPNLNSPQNTLPIIQQGPPPHYQRFRDQPSFIATQPAHQSQGPPIVGPKLIQAPANGRHLNISKEAMPPIMKPHMMMNQQLGNQSERCRTHGEANVGWDEQAKEIVCNTCIWENKVGQLKFTALMSKELKESFTKSHQKYKESCNNVNEIDPSIVKRHLQQTINDFFNNLSNQVKVLEKGVMQKIKTSESLKELEKILERDKEFFKVDQSQPDQFEKEKNKFDEKITKGRFASVVKNKEFYQQLTDVINNHCNRMKETFTQSSEQMQRVIKLQSNERVIQDQLQNIVKDCIMIDMESVKPASIKDPSFQEIQQLNQNNAQMQPLQQHQMMVHSPVTSPQKSDLIMQQPQIVQQSLPPNQQQQTIRQSHQTENQISNIQQPIQRLPFPQQQQPLKPHTSQVVCQSVVPQVQQQQLQQQSASDDVVITGTNQVNTVQELNYPTCYKLKSMNLLKLIPTKGFLKIKEIPGLFMCKCVFTHDGRVFVIGGAKDQRNQQTIADVTEYQVNPTGEATTNRKAPMIDPRASFGCTLSAQRGEIMVAGGYINGQATKKCERYSILNDQWTKLPELNEDKCSTSLCVLDTKWLYSIGGLTKVDTQLQLSNIIERLDLTTQMSKWEILPLKMVESACDVGSLPISASEILVFGGWNKQSLQNTYIIKKCDQVPSFSNQGNQAKHELKHVEVGLDKPDFFLMSGIAMKTDNVNVVKVCGHTSLFSFDLRTKRFVGSSNV